MTSGCAFSISSKSTTRIGTAADFFGELAAFLVTDIAGRRADEARDVELLHVLAHVELDERVRVAEHEFGQRLARGRFCRRRSGRGR